MEKQATKSQPKSQPKNQEDVSFFIQDLWFKLFFFILLLMIASFGLIAES